MNIQNIETAQIRNIKDVHAIANAYLAPIKVGVARITDTTDGKNRMGFRLIVGRKVNPQFEPLDVNQIFKGDVAINKYIATKYAIHGDNWPEHITTEDVEKLVNVAKSRKLENTEEIIVNIHRCKRSVPDVRIAWLPYGMTGEMFINTILRGIKESLTKKEPIIDTTITSMDKMTNKSSEDILREMDSGDFAVDAEDSDMPNEIGADETIDTMLNEVDDDEIDDISQFSEEDIENEMTGLEETSKQESEDSQMEETLGTIASAISELNKFVQTLDQRLDNLESKPAPKKSGRPKKIK